LTPTVCPKKIELVEIIVYHIDQLIVFLWFLPVTLSIILPLGVGLVWLGLVLAGSVLNSLFGPFGSLDYRELNKVRHSKT
jgi:hypothetical protein